MLMDMSLPKFDICQATGATEEPQELLMSSFFFSRTFCLMSGLKFTLPDTWRNIGSIQQSVWA